MNNQKIENQLNLALEVPVNDRESSKSLSTGFNQVTNTWELIVKYNGDLAVLDETVIRIDKLNNQYAVIVVSEDKINTLASFPQIEYIEKPKEFSFSVENGRRAACITPVQEGYPNLTGKGVLVGIIDSGIDYFHPDFRNEDGTTRIISILDLGKKMGTGDTGIEYTEDQINQALKAKTNDEGYNLVPIVDQIGHGTHVAGIAAGNGRASQGKNKGVAYESELIIVKLGQGITPIAQTTQIMKGIAFIIDKARSENKPVAINISFGNNYGSHDGSSLFETYIDSSSNSWKNVIAVGSGNEGAAAHHYRNTIREDETQIVDVAISESEKDVSIQLWKSYSDSFLIEIESPSGKKSGYIKPILGTQSFVLGKTKIFVYFGEPSPYNSDQEVYFVFIPVDEFIDNGGWKIRIQGEKIVRGTYHMWLPISAGINPYTRFLSPEVNTSLTVPATTTKVITVGGYNTSNNSIASFSGRGFTREINIVKPNLVAPAVDILSTVPGGGYDTKSGTSMATPFVTGASALLMQWGIVEGNDPFLYGEKVKAYLQKSAKRESGRTYPDPSWGYGSLCLAGVFEQPVLSVLNHTFGDKCSEAIISENYLDLIIEYTENLNAVIEQYQPACVQVIDDQYAILQIEAKGCKNLTKLSSKISKTLLPKLIAPYSKSALNASGILVFHNQPYVPLTGSGILIGVVDTGIDYKNNVFKYEDNTSKIVYLWDQTIEGNPPEHFMYGTEYSREQINEALSSSDPNSVVPSNDESGHGTFLAGIAAGREVADADFIGAAPDAELVVVKLKPAKKCLKAYYIVDEELEDVYQSNDLMLGVNYLVEKSKELNKPLSIIIGLGSTQGSHDGSSMLETYLLNVAKREGRAVSVAAGNEANLAHHYYNLFAKNEPFKKVEINVAKNEMGFIFYIWNNAPDKISIAITSPTGEYIDRIPARLTQVEQIKLILEETTISVEYNLTEERTGDQQITVRMVKPTEGIWTITLFGDIIVDGRVDIWLPREGFIKPETVFLMPSAYTTATLPSTSIGLTTAGAYNHESGSLFLGSGRGLTRDLELKPDLVAPGVNVIGPLPGNRFGAMSGTSISAAFTAGASALLMEWGIVNGNDPEMNNEKIRNYLIRGAKRKDSLDYPNREWGFGELNLLGTFEALKG